MKQALFILILPVLLAAGCAGMRLPVSYEPNSDTNVNSFYVNGLSYASVRTDSFYVSISIPPQTSVSNKDFLRVWVLLQNLSKTPCVFSPSRNVKLQIVNAKSGFVAERRAENPAALVKKIHKTEAAETMLTLLREAGDSAAMASNLQTGYKVADIGSMKVTPAEGQSFRVRWHSILRDGISSTTLHRNTLFPNESVNGFLYFPLKMGKQDFSGILFKENNYTLVVEVLTPDRPVSARFALAYIE